MHPNNIQELLKKYREGTCTDEEKALLESWYLTYEANDRTEIPPHVREEHLAKVWQSLPVHRQQRRIPWLRMTAAAALLLTLGASLYYYFQKTAPAKAGEQLATNTTIVPGSNKAILTLGNGQKISLTDAGNGQIAKQAGITITKQADGQLLYTIDEAGPGDEISFNTIETPRGGQYQVALPDGSKVWLNAATALRFPTRFSATERTVYLDGEAYFEIAHNSKSPFRVSVNGQQVEVLGTHFNIMAYKDEQTVRTTLLEGAVKLTAPVGSILLKPGQQGYIAKEKNVYNSAYVDVTMVTAWKDGLFKFDSIDMRTLMRQISRWYDVEVIYEPGVKDDVVFGSISRRSDLTRLLRILELGGVHFRVEGRKLIVLP
ncbi:FecR family protein [Niastella sp. OAS944]|uniref:FecR family protein n=1 Tax=Niastella sp. OAS944 TaxID=2664089 RepID=UPI00346DA6A0|nr:hypothetical protein [Chitinophagaceae bacterium OAS944]